MAKAKKANPWVPRSHYQKRDGTRPKVPCQNGKNKTGWDGLNVFAVRMLFSVRPRGKSLAPDVLVGMIVGLSPYWADIGCLPLGGRLLVLQPL
jgi:hypothetical protein